jgi:Cytochrome b5-like Heme/Steroid binding domain
MMLLPRTSSIVRYQSQIKQIAVRSLSTTGGSSATSRWQWSANNNNNSNNNFIISLVGVSTFVSLATALSSFDNNNNNNYKNTSVSQLEGKQDRHQQSTSTNYNQTATNKQNDMKQNDDFNQPSYRPDLPIYSMDSLWYTFRGGVYDMTSFVNGHPGGTPVSYYAKQTRLFK